MGSQSSCFSVKGRFLQMKESVMIFYFCQLTMFCYLSVWHAEVVDFGEPVRNQGHSCRVPKLCLVSCILVLLFILPIYLSKVSVAQEKPSENVTHH